MTRPTGADHPFSTTIYHGVDARPNKDWAIMAPDTANIPSFEVLMGEPEQLGPRRTPQEVHVRKVPIVR